MQKGKKKNLIETFEDNIMHIVRQIILTLLDLHK